MALSTRSASNGGDDDLPGYSPSVDRNAPGAPSATAGPSSGASNAETEPLFSDGQSPWANSPSSAAAGEWSGTRWESNARSWERAGPLASENVAELNPESRKKLAMEAERNGNSPGDYNFHSEAELATNLPPPSFGANETADRPSYKLDSSGNITSHSAQLNSSPSALLRFLRLHASAPPRLSVHLRGTHIEKKHETIFEVGKNGRRRQRTETRDEEVEDFQFWIDAAHCVEEGLGRASGGGAMRGLLYEVGGYECVRRGAGHWATRELTKDEPQEGAIRLPVEEDEQDAIALEEGAIARKRTKWKAPGYRERKKLAKAKRERDARGLPAFVDPKSLVDLHEDERALAETADHPALIFKSHFADVVETHSSTAFGLTSASASIPAHYATVVAERERRDEQVRQVVEAYCRSKNSLKELTIHKELYGWNWRLLEQGLRAVIADAGYTGTVQVSFRVTPEQITIRPENFWSHIFSVPVWAKVLLWIVYIYPILLIIEFFNGARFEQLRVAFPLTRWRRLPLPAHAVSANVTGSEALAIAKPLAARPPRVSRMSPSSAGKGYPQSGPSSSAAGGSLSSQTDAGDAESKEGEWMYLTGLEEGEWLRGWERSVAAGVRQRVRGQALDRNLGEAAQASDPRQALRGYSA